MKKTRKSYPEEDLTKKEFGYLKPLYYIKGGYWKCKCKCGNETIVDTRNLKSGHTKSCGCLKRESKNFYDMIGYENNGIKVIDRYGSDEQQIALWKCICKRCGKEFIARGSSIRAGYINSCGCIHSNNEIKITKMLLENNIEFATQYTFPNLKGNSRNLRFDFAIFNNGKLSHLIEYQGQQHYEKPKGSWANGYENTVKYDKLKKDYCAENNIRLIEIKYNEDYSIKDLL